jgi:hypothetical protein
LIPILDLGWISFKRGGRATHHFEYCEEQDVKHGVYFTALGRLFMN